MSSTCPFCDVKLERSPIYCPSCALPIERWLAPPDGAPSTKPLGSEFRGPTPQQRRAIARAAAWEQRSRLAAALLYAAALVACLWRLLRPA